MGALSEEAASEVAARLKNINHLRLLFSEQHKYLDYFFEHLDFEQVHNFTQLCVASKGVIFFSGVGKSGFIGQKISQTLVSTGTKSVFLSPTDALHGDIGIVGPTDILVLFSKSGSTEELLRLIPAAKAKGAYLVGISSVKGSKLDKACDMHVTLPLERELCPFDLAPVTSTTIQMLFGDTVAIALMQAKKLTREEYALNHPAGRIGKRLILKVQDVMRKGDELPLCREGDSVMESLVELSAKGCGCLLVMDAQGKLMGTFTDGDLRRSLKSLGEGLMKKTVGEVCHRTPRTVQYNTMAIDAMQKMEKPTPIACLPVLSKDSAVVGLVTLHGLITAGL